MSSPVTTAIRTLPARPRSRAAAKTASAHAIGFTPPAFATTRIPRLTISGSSRAIKGTKSLAYPRHGSRERCFCMMDMVTSAR